jgi:AcrR family transcriptional regulator
VTGRTGDAIAIAITQAAAQLVAWHQDPTVGAVAQATGVARGTIYRYFSTRQALLSAVLDQALRQTDHHLSQAVLAAVPVIDGLGAGGAGFGHPGR